MPPGLLVQLDDMSVAMLSQEFQLTEVPGPAYDKNICGIFKDGDIGIVLTTAKVSRSGEPVLEDIYARVLVSSGVVGWINVNYIQKLHEG
jgi:hypothetical protein